jgi:hypothetical protein
MSREKIDDDPEHTCSQGLHVASWNYAQNYSGSILVDCKVNPKNVVSIPIDHNFMKLRCCEYEVIAISKGKKEELHMSDDNSIIKDVKKEHEIGNNSKEFIQGKEDAITLITYFKSISKKYSIDEFINLKRFQNKSYDYISGINKKAVELLS